MTVPANSSPPFVPPKLPVEIQTLAFVDFARSQDRATVKCQVKWDGYKILLRYYKEYRVEGADIYDVLMIASIESPERIRGRDWFWYYCQLCLSLVDGGLVLESIVNKSLEHSLQQRPDFVLTLLPKTYFLKKLGPDHRPMLARTFTLTPSEIIQFMN